MKPEGSITDELAFSVVIPTRNRPRQLLEALKAISRTNFDRDSVETIVVADGRGQELDVLIRESDLPIRIRLIELDHQGPSVARNAGAAAARGKYVAFTDDDCLPSAGWLDALEVSLEQAPGALVGGRTTNLLQNNVHSETSQLIHQLVYRHYNRQPEQALFLASNNLATRTVDFVSIGGFDAEFRIASEDREFCDRWLWDGRPMRYEENAWVEHVHELSLGQFCRQHFRYGRGAARYHRERAKRGSGKFGQHLSFHRRLENWLTPEVEGRVLRQVQIRTLLVVWQISNSLGFLYETFLQAFRRDAE